MSDSNGGCFIAGLTIGGTIAIVIGTGILTWSWIEPDDFWSAVVFVLVWGVLGKIGHMLLMLIVAGIASLFEN